MEWLHTTKSVYEWASFAKDRGKEIEYLAWITRHGFYNFGNLNGVQEKWTSSRMQPRSPYSKPLDHYRQTLYSTTKLIRKHDFKIDFQEDEL